MKIVIRRVRPFALVAFVGCIASNYGIRDSAARVLSGWLPAMQAAKLDPVEALRYE